MPTPHADVFLQGYLARNTRSTRVGSVQPQWLSWVVALLLALGTTTGLMVDYPATAMGVWVLVASVVGTRRLRPLVLLQGALMTVAAIFALQGVDALRLYTPALLWLAAGSTASFWLSRSAAIWHLSRSNAREAALLHQLCAVWARSDGSCLKEIDLEGRLLAMAVKRQEVIEVYEPGDTTDVVDQLRALGVRIAVDDFGTGYSTLGSLKSFVPDTLKIDKQFLNEVEHDAADQAIVRGVIEMAHALNMTVVAEGVECAQQKAMLEQLDCDQIQGYLLSPPIGPTAFAEQFLQRCNVPSPML